MTRGPQLGAVAASALVFIVRATSPSHTPTPSLSGPAVQVAHTSGDTFWPTIAPAWIGALGTAGLLMGAILTVVFAVKAFNKQSKEVELIQEQLTDQRKVNQKQASVLDLQAADLRESLEERKRESELRHRYQAVRVFPRVEVIPGEPKQHYVIVTNSSNLPVYNVVTALHWSWTDGESTRNLPEHLEPALMPGAAVRIPSEGGVTCETPQGSEPVWAQTWFRDAQLVHWTVTSKGEIVERLGPPASIGSLGRLPADLDPGRRPRGHPFHVS
jgi:hypothetical protein